MTRTHPPEFKTKAAFLDWMVSRADSLAADLRRSSPPSLSRPEIDLRLQMASLLQCADFVMQLSEAGAAITTSRKETREAQYIALDIGHLRSEGYLDAPHEAGTLILRKPPIMLGFKIDRESHDHATLRIGKDGREQTLTITTTQPSFGGRRFWLVCPGLERRCDNRVLRIYRTVDGGVFACHACHKAAHDRGWRTARDRHVHFSTIQRAG